MTSLNKNLIDAFPSIKNKILELIVSNFVYLNNSALSNTTQNEISNIRNITPEYELDLAVFCKYVEGMNVSIESAFADKIMRSEILYSKEKVDEHKEQQRFFHSELNRIISIFTKYRVICEV